MQIAKCKRKGRWQTGIKQVLERLWAQAFPPHWIGAPGSSMGSLNNLFLTLHLFICLWEVYVISLTQVSCLQLSLTCSFVLWNSMEVSLCDLKFLAWVGKPSERWSGCSTVLPYQTKIKQAFLTRDKMVPPLKLEFLGPAWSRAMLVLAFHFWGQMWPGGQGQNPYSCMGASQCTKGK